MASFSAPVRRWRGKGESRTLSDHYWVRITDGTHRTWKSTGKSTEKLAEQVRKTWELQDAKGERHVDTKTFTEAADAWLEEKKDKGIAKTTAAVFGVYVRAWSRHWGKKPIRSVTTDHVERYLKLRSGKLAPRSLNNERKRLASFFKWCGKRGWIRGNPAADVGAYHEVKKVIRVLSEDEERRLLEEARAGGEDLYGFTLCLLASGLRRGTVAALEWRDVDWTAAEWRIPAKKMKSREDFTGRPIDPELFAYMKARRRPGGWEYAIADVNSLREGLAKLARLHEAEGVQGAEGA